MVPLRFIFAIATITASGYFTLAIILKDLKKYSPLELLAISFGIGCGVVTLGMFFISLLKIRFTALSLMLFQVPIYALGMRKLLRGKRPFFGAWPKLNLSFIEILLVLLILFNIAYVTLVASSMPFLGEEHWDSWSHWGYKAKYFFIKQGIDDQIFAKVSQGGAYNADYPLLFPLSETYAWIMLGQVHEPCARLLISFFYVAMLIIFYSVLGKRLKNYLALGFTYVLASTPAIAVLAFTAYADIAVGFYISAAVLYMWLYLQDSDSQNFLLGCLFLGIGMWTKNEAVSQWVTLILLFLFLRQAKKASLAPKKILLLVILPFAVILPWLIFRMSIGAATTHLSPVNPGEAFNLWDISRLSVILASFGKQFINISQWNLFWVLFIIAVCASYKRLDAGGLFLLLLVLSQMAIFVVVYYIWPIKLWELDWQIGNTLDRILCQLAPLMLFFAALQSSRFFAGGKEA
jgi:4-amino-4-deoxy-L-arabinose transferase-like glycosyltransferase